MTVVRPGVQVTRRGRRRPRLLAEGAQATVELALVLPVVMLVIWLGVEASLLLRDQVLVTHAAREAARALAVGAAPDQAVATARADTDLGAAVDIAVSSGMTAGSSATATAHLAERERLPIIGRLAPGLEVSSSVTMRVEGPP